jgi:hypothetical protein
MSSFKYKKVKDYKIEVRTKNDILFATIEEDADGFFYLWMNHNLNAAWHSQALRELADKLDKLNREWDIKIQQDIGK